MAILTSLSVPFKSIIISFAQASALLNRSFLESFKNGCPKRQIIPSPIIFSISPPWK